ncbi:MAG: hydroxymethylbilane synthase [Bacteroidota bacterium]
MNKTIRIGTRESQLAVWQADLVKDLLKRSGVTAELVFIKSEGDIDLVTPLYEMGVQGVFTRSLDAALLNNKIDIAVHSMKDVPTQLPKGIIQSAILQRASYKDLLVYKDGTSIVNGQLTTDTNYIIATSSIRRKAQWLNKYPHHTIENLRGNVNTRLQKVKDNNWNGAIFAAAGLERINLRPENSIELDWMLPAPAQGAIMIVCREDDNFSFDACKQLNDNNTAICTKIERDFLRMLLGGCSTPISALAEIENDKIIFKGNICTVDGKQKIDINKIFDIADANTAGTIAANELLKNGGDAIVDSIRNV